MFEVFCPSFPPLRVSAALPFCPNHDGFSLKYMEVRDFGIEKLGRWSKEVQTLEWTMWQVH